MAATSGPELVTDPTDPLASRARVIEWYRLDASRRLVRALGPSTAVLTVGAVLVSFGTAVGSLSVSSAVLGGLGLLLVIAGPIAALVGLKRVLEAEDYLILRTDGILHHIADNRRTLPWDDVERVVYDEAADAIELRMCDDTSFRIAHRFSGISRRDLAARLEELRRKALWSLLPGQR